MKLRPSKRTEDKGQRTDQNRPPVFLSSVLCPLSSGRRGLSLIEVLLALTIFLLALVVISRLVDMGTSRELESRFQTRGTRLAQTKLADFESGVESVTSPTTQGTFEGDDSAWSWQATVEPHDTAPNLYVVSVKVYRDLKGQEFSVTLSQLMLDPAVVGTAAEAARPDPNAAGGMP